MVSIKEDSLEDIIPVGRSIYYDRLVEFLKKFRIPVKCPKVVRRGRWCALIDGTDIVFRDPKTKGYLPLRRIEMFKDGTTIISSETSGRGWYLDGIPLEEIWVYDHKGDYKNYKGHSFDKDIMDDLVHYSIYGGKL